MLQCHYQIMTGIMPYVDVCIANEEDADKALGIKSKNSDVESGKIDFATAASCLKHSIEGDFNRVTINDIEQLLYNGGNGRVVR